MAPRPQLLLAATVVILFVFSILAPTSGQRRRPRGDRPPYNVAGGKLLETNLYQLYAQIYYNRTEPCTGPPEQSVSVSLIFDVDENFVITNDETYRKRFEQELLPAIKKLCGSVQKVRLEHFYKNVKFVYIRPKVQELRRDEASSEDERAFSAIDARLDEATGRFQFSKPQYASIADFRNQRKAEEQAEARRQVQVEENLRERQKQLDAAEAERKKKLDLETNGGQEPNSEELAVAGARVLLMGFGCTRISFNDVCQQSISGLTLKLVSATKYKCKPVTIGANYHCEYNFKVDCGGHPLLCFGIEHDLNSMRHKSGFKRNGKDWSMYILSEAEKSRL